MGTAGRFCLGHDGPTHDDSARRLRHLLRARGRGCGGPAELPVTVHSNRVLRADPGVHHVELLYGNAGDESECCAGSGQLSGAWLPCLAQLTSFPDPNGAATYGGCTGPGVNSTQNLFVLEVPRHFVVPNTQQWNLTVQREMGRHWVLEVGYVGTRGIHLRETRDAIQSVNAAPPNPFTVYGHKRQQLHHHHEHLRQRDCAYTDPWIERVQRLSDIRQRCVLDLSRTAGNGVAAMGRQIIFRQPTPSPRTLTPLRRGTRRSTRPTTIRATSMLRAAFRTSTVRTASRSAMRTICRSSHMPQERRRRRLADGRSAA